MDSRSQWARRGLLGVPAAERERVVAAAAVTSAPARERPAADRFAPAPRPSATSALQDAAALAAAGPPAGSLRPYSARTTLREAQQRREPRTAHWQQQGALRRRLEPALLPGRRRPLQQRLPYWPHEAGDGEPAAFERLDVSEGSASSASAPASPLLSAAAAAPPPVPQLEVLHVQRTAGSPESLAVVLPGGGFLGSGPGWESRVFQPAPTVVLLPGGLPPVARSPGGGDGLQELTLQELTLQVPAETPAAVEAAARRRQLLSTSQRLATLLGSESTEGRRLSVDAAAARRLAASAAGPRAAAGAAAGGLLRQHRGAVLRQVDALTDLVWQQILEDTVQSLEGAAGTPGAFASRSRPQAVGPLAAQATSAGGGRAAAAERRPGSAAVEATGPQSDWVSAAAMELAALEAELKTRYCSPGSRRPPASAAGPSCAIGSAGRQGGAGGAGAGRLLSELPDEALALRPAALPLERVREIERYRYSFAQHCTAAREAGIDIGVSSLESSTSTATWLIWPFLADRIVAMVVDEVLEETHEALGVHDDDDETIR